MASGRAGDGARELERERARGYAERVSRATIERNTRIRVIGILAVGAAALVAVVVKWMIGP